MTADPINTRGKLGKMSPHLHFTLARAPQYPLLLTRQGQETPGEAVMERYSGSNGLLLEHLALENFISVYGFVDPSRGFWKGSSSEGLET